MKINRRSLLRLSLCVLCLGLLSPAWLAGETPQQVTLTVLGTTDLHANLMPVDYYANRPANRGLAKIATLVRQIRKEQPNVVLVDSGDTIQGSPLAFYFARKDTAKTNPTVAVMNAMGYDAMAVGNHEFNFGLDVLWKAKRESRFPWLAANVRQSYKDETRRFGDYIIKNVGGVRVAIVGFVTPGVPRWEIPANYRGYEFRDIVETAKRVVPRLRKKADVVIALVHSGQEREETSASQASEAYSTVPRENIVNELAKAVPGIDAIFFGHSHREVPQQIVNGVLLAQARNWAQSLARADITLARGPKGRWRVVSKRSTTIPVTESLPMDPEIQALAQPYHDATQAYLDAAIATSAQETTGMTARYEDHPFVDLIHKVQMEYGKADVSLAAMFFPAARVPAGRVTVRQVAAIYIYENTLYTVEMSGAQLREILEHAASYYPQWPVKEGETIRLPGYNADTAEGVSYVIDLSQPPGQRIRDLTFQGRPLDAAQKLRVATNNYRYTGGGQYTTFRGLPLVYQSPQETRELMLEYVTRTGVLPTQASGNWKIVPREAVDAMIAEAKRREEQRAASSSGNSR